MQEQLAQVFSKVDELWNEEVSFLQTLGRFPSVLGQEAQAQEWIAEAFRSMQLETDVFVPDVELLSSNPEFQPQEWSFKDRPIVVGKLPGSGSKTGRSLILQGHVDVVSPEPISLWDRDPWEATIEGDRMYGRGICDMKSGVTAMIYAVKAIQQAGYRLAADVTLEAVHEEECTGMGALATLCRGYTADGALIPEAFGRGVLVSQVGVIWMRVRVVGAGAHVERASRAVNAIHKAMFLIESLDAYRATINSRARHPDYIGKDHPLNVNIGTIHAGDWPSTVPSECVFEVRIGFYPGVDPQSVKDEVRSWLLDAAKKDDWLRESPPEIEFIGFHARGLSLSQNQPLFEVLQNAHEAVVGKRLIPVVSTATTDIRFYNLDYGIPTTCYGPYGENSHGPNEWVDLPSVKECTKTYAAFIMEWCGVAQE